MTGALIGAAFGMAAGAAGITIAGFTAGTMWMVGASIGAMFDKADMGLDNTSPTYSLGELSNTKSQLVPIPVVYGQCRVGGNVFLQDFLDDKKERMNMFVAVSEGEIQAISDVMANDQDPVNDLDDCSVSKYLGTSTQTKDSRHPTISTELTTQGYTGNYENLAYIALTLKAQEKLSGTPTISSIVQGRKVWTPDGVQYSRNPVWCLIDLLSNERYGLGMWVNDHPNWGLIDYDCAVESASYCDEIVGDSPRFQLDYVVDTQKPCIDVMTDILSTFRGYVIGREKIQICIDKPSTVYKYIDMSNIIEGSFSWKQQDPDNMYNRVVINWTNPDDSYESNAYIIEDEDSIARYGVIEKTYDLPGITTVDQVARMGAYLIDMANGVRNFCSFGLSLSDGDIEVGDVIGVTHDLPGWGNYDGEHPDNPAKLMRVTQIDDVEDDNGLESIAVTCAEYVEEVYNDRAGDIPVKIDTGIDNPWDPDEVTDLAITEQLILGSDGTYHQTAICSWTLPDGILEGIEVWWKYSLDSEWKQSATLSPYANSYTFLDLEIGETLQVKVITVSNWGVRSTGATATQFLSGDGESPDAPSSVTAVGSFRTIYLNWMAPASLDLSHYEVWESTDSVESNATKIAEVTSPSFVVSNLGVLVTRWYWIKAVDYAGNTSPSSTVVSATTTTAVSADIADAAITGDHIAATAQISIGTGGRLVIGDEGYIQIGDNGPILLDISNDYPRIRIGDPDNATTGPYMELTQGDIEVYKYYDSAYELQKNLRKIVSGIATNNTTVTLAGHWESQPEIICSVNEIVVYNKDYVGQNQTLQVSATNVTWDNETKTCTFKPLAKLLISATSTTTSPGEQEHDALDYTFPRTVQTGSYTIPANTTSVTINFKYSAQHGGYQVWNEDDYTSRYYTRTAKTVRVKVYAVISGVGDVLLLNTTTDKTWYTDITTTPHYTSVQKTISISSSTSSRTISLKCVFSDGDENYSDGTHRDSASPDLSSGWLYFTSFVCSASSASAIATGKLNYLAIGE